MSAATGFAELMAPDILTPDQWYAAMRREDPRFSGIKQLMLAVLVDALHCLQIGERSRNGHQRQAFAEADVWIADRKGGGPFAFETVCETLGINPDWLRENLREWHRQQLNGNSTRGRIRRSPTLRSRQIGASVPRRRRREAGHPLDTVA